MRIDKFLNTANITKRRSVAEDMCKSGVVSINGVIAKPAKIVKIGDIISIQYKQKTTTYKIVDIPDSRTTAKSQQHLYIKEL